jgi:hypothetical protein
MKKLFYILLLLGSTYVFAQNKGMTYQAVIYAPGGQNVPGVNVANVPMTNRTICLQFSLLDASSGLEYQEVVKTKTDEFGMVNITIGSGTQTGGYATSFGAVVWSASADKSMKVALDATGLCNQYEELSVEKLDAVPFANAAITAGNVTGVVALTNGGTGATTAAGARTNLGIGNVDNTSDLNKPMSTATKTYVDSQLTNSTIVDADANTKGKVQLAGDLAGTAAAPTVPSLALKENATNKSTTTTLGTSNVLFPTQNAVKTYVDTAIAGATIVDADANTKGKIQLAGDLAGTAAAPTVPGLALKENAANKSTTTTLGTSNVLFPTQNAVKTYVDTAIAGATIVDADANTKGKIRLAGDLSGTAAAPTVPGLALKLDASLAGVPNGIATLNSAGIIPANQLPPISVASTNVVGSQAAMLALSNATVGSIAVRTDVNKNFILSTAGPSVLANWIELLTPGAPVQSVNGLTGAIQLSKADINLANVDNTSDAAKPVSTATQNALNLKLNTNQVGVPNGTASLNALGKIPTEQIPAISFSSVKVLASQAEMLAQTNALIGSVVIRTDVNKNYVLAQSDPTILANWVELLTPAPPVQSVNGYVGNLSLTKADLGLGNVDNTGDINKPVSTPTQNALDLKANLASPSFTGTVSGITKSMVGLANVDNTTDLNKPVSTATQTALDLKANTVDLTAETTRATAAEATLTTNVATNATAIAAETTRATAAEATLTTNVATNATAIAAETTRATAAEATLTTNVATNTTAIAAETTRATAAEATLTTNVATNATAIAAETTRATAAETTLTTNLAAEVTRATAAEALKANATDVTTSLALKANLASPTFTGTPTAPTPATADNSTTIATTEYVKNSIVAANAGLSTIGNISATSNAKGAVINGTTELVLTPADATNGGVVTTGAQTFAGAKTFNSDIKVNDITVGGGSQTYGNTALGYLTLASNQPASYNAGSWNTAIGHSAMYRNTNGNYNTAIGKSALTNNTTGKYNTAIGYYAGSSLYTVSSTFPTDNTLIGTASGMGITTGSFNTIIGSQTYNVVSGYPVGIGITTGSNNTIIGSKILGLSPTLSNNVILADGSGNIRAQHDGTNGWTLGTISSGTWNGTEIAITKGGTGATTAADARTNLGLGNVDNTTDANKPVSTATQTALDLKENAANKTLSVSTDGASDVKFPSAKAVKTYVDTAVSSSSTTAVPYTGATGAVNLGAYDLTVNGLTVGKGGGSDTSNTALGNQALSNNVIGVGAAHYGTNNTALGYQSMLSNTNGFSNSSFGNSALKANTTGAWNTAIGSGALKLITNGFSNTSIGMGSLDFLTSGSDNIAIGSSAGRSFVGGNLTISNQSIYIGGGSKSNANSSSNEVVIGYNTSGNGNNTVTIGNTSVTDNYFKGNINLTGNVNGGTWNGTEIAIAKGGTGATTAAAALTNLGAEPTANKSTATDLGNSAPSDVLFPSQKAVKAYVDAQTAAAGVSDGSITSAKIADGTIVNADVSTTAAIAYSKLNLASSIVVGDLAADAVETVKIKDANVTAAKLAADAVETAKIKNLNVTTDKLAADAVTSAKITDGTIVVGDLADNAVETAKIKAAAVTNAKLDKANIPLSGFGAAAADVALGANKLTGVADPTLAQDAATKNYVDTATAGITTLADGKIYLGNASNVATEVTPSGDVTMTNAGVTAIGTGKVVVGMLATDAVETLKIKDANVTAAKLATDAVETVKIKDANVTAAKLAADAVETAKVKDANITYAKIQNVATGKVLGRVSANAGVVEEIATTGTGDVVRATSPTLVTPTLGAATATTINKVTITQPTTSATLTIADGKTLTANNSIVVAGTDATTMTFPTTDATIARTDAAQTFTGVQTFSSDIVVNSVNIGRGKGAVATNTAVGTDAISATATGTENAAMGYNALKTITSGSYNTALGSQAAKILSLGTENTAVGYQALSSSINASANTAVGKSALAALADLTTNDRNTAVGMHSFLNLVTGQYNVGLGQGTLLNATTGSNNVALGKYAGFRDTSDAGVTTSNQSIFIGSESRPLSSTSTNEIVIGYDARGLGNNSTVIGNTLTSQAKLFGALSIPNTTNSTSSTTGALKVAGGAGIDKDLNVGGNVKINGTLEIDGGTPGAGKVLTSDANGVGSWTAIPATNLTSGVSGILPGANGGTGVDNGTKTITLGGNLTTSGAFATTLTSTAATTVTLPTTGTLATLAGTETLTNKTLTSPTLTTPALGVATATSINGLTPTALATGFTIAGGSTTSKTLTVSGDATVSGTTSGTNTGDQTITLTGDVTGSGTGSFAATIGTGKVTTSTIAADAVTSAKIADATIVVGDLADNAVETAKIKDANVTYAKIQNVSATDKVLGRVTAGAGVIEEIATTGSGNVVRATSPTLVTPVIGAATGTSLSVSGQLTSTVATGTAPLVVTSTTPVANLSIGGTAATATNIAGGAAGSIPYQTAAATTAMLAKGTDGQVLTLASGEPSWATPAGVTSIGTIGSTANVNGGSIASGVLTLQPASSGFGGVVTTAAQTFAGAKTFTSVLTVNPTASSTLDGATMSITGQSTTAASKVGGLIGVTAGNGGANGNGGAINLLGGTGGTNANGGDINITGGASGAALATGGSIKLTPGGFSTTTSGTVSVVNSDLFVNNWNFRVGMGRNYVNTNTAVGINTLGAALLSGGSNVAFGMSALTANTTGGFNTALGTSSLTTNTTGSNNTAVGNNSLNLNSSGGDNVAIGYKALEANTTGSFNVAIGSNAISERNSTTSNNVGIGYYAMRYNNGSNNVAVGYYAGGGLGFGTTAGNNNVFLGHYAGMNAGPSSGTNTTGSNSVMIGYDVRPAATGETNQIVISGYNGTASTVGQGANTTSIGNSATTKAVIYGSILSNLPTTASSGNGGDFTLEAQDGFTSGTTNGGNINLTPGTANGGTAGIVKVNGQIQITGGTPGLGKVLTSDANGLASWSNNGGGVLSKTATYTILTTDNANVLVFSGSTASQTITLPSAVTVGAGREITIKNVASVSVAIASAAGYLISDSTTTTATGLNIGVEPSNNWIKAISDGTNWIILRALF